MRMAMAAGLLSGVTTGIDQKQNNLVRHKRRHSWKILRNQRRNCARIMFFPMAARFFHGYLIEQTNATTPLTAGLRCWFHFLSATSALSAKK